MEIPWLKVYNSKSFFKNYNLINSGRTLSPDKRAVDKQDSKIEK